MNLAVIGSGGREHAICYKLKQSSKIKKLICIPGNAGTEKIAENIDEDILNFEAIYKIINILILYLILHISPELLLAKNKLLEARHSNKLIDLKEYFFQKLHKRHNRLPQ